MAAAAAAQPEAPAPPAAAEGAAPAPGAADHGTVTVRAHALRSRHFWDRVPAGDARLFCLTPGLPSDPPRLEEALAGDRILRAPFSLPAASSVLFMDACTTTWTASQIKAVNHFVQDEFCLPWTLDGVPAIWTPAQATGTNAAGVASDAIKCHEAVPLGYALPDGQVAVYNHATWTIYRVAGSSDIAAVEVSVLSFQPPEGANGSMCLSSDGLSTTCPPLTLPASPPEAPFVVPFSFSVKQAEVESYAALPVDVMQVEAQAATVRWSEWMLPLLVLAGVLALLHRSDRALFGSMAPVGGVTRRATTPAPNVIRQMRDDMTLTPPMATALGALVAMGAHIGIVALTLIECYVVAASSIVSWTLVVRLFVGLYMATAYGGARPAANCVLLRTKPQELWDLAAPPFGTASVVAGYQQARLERLLHGKAESIPWQVAKTSSALPASPLGLSNTVAAEAPASGWRAPLAWWGWQSVHAYSYLMMAVLAVSDLVRVWSLHVVTIPLRSLVVLAALWVTFAVPATLAGRYLGGQARPLSALVDSRLVYLLGVLAFVLAWFIHVGYLFAAVPPMILYHVGLAKHVVPCKERKVVVTPWHVTSMAANASAPERVAMVLGTLAAGSLPFWVLALELRPLLDALTGDGIFIAPWRLAFVVAVYVAVTWLTGWLVCSVAVMRKDYVALSWKGFATGAACGLYLFLYCLDYYGSLSSLRPLSFANGVAFLTFSLLASAGLALATGALTFFAVQAYIIKLFQSYGTMVTADAAPEERYLTLNGVRFDAPVVV